MKRSGVVLSPLPGFRTKAREKPEQLWRGTAIVQTPKRQEETTLQSQLGWGQGRRSQKGREHRGQWGEPPLSLPALLQLLKFFCLQGLGPVGERWEPLPCPSLQMAAALEESGNTCHQHTFCAHGHREARATCQGLLPHLTFLCQAHGLSIEGTEGEDTRRT